MKNYEIGILPESSYFSFSPNAQTKELFLYPTMCGHLFCTREYYIKRNYFPRLLLIYVCSGTFHLKLEAQEYHASDGQVLLFDCTKPHHYYATDALEFYYLHFLIAKLPPSNFPLKVPLMTAVSVAEVASDRKSVV